MQPISCVPKSRCVSTSKLSTCKSISSKLLLVGAVSKFFTKQAFINILQNSQEHSCAGAFVLIM